MPIPERQGICTPMVVSDIEDYLSPVDGSPIRSRSGQRYDLAKNGCVLKETSANFHPEEYRWRKAQQAQQLAKRKQAFSV